MAKVEAAARKISSLAVLAASLQQWPQTPPSSEDRAGGVPQAQQPRAHSDERRRAVAGVAAALLLAAYMYNARQGDAFRA